MLEQFENKESRENILQFINNFLYVDDNAAYSIYRYFKEQYLYSLISTNKEIVIEYYSEGYEDSKKYVIFHTLFGRRVNDVLSRAVAYVLGKIHKRDLEIGINDNGFFIASKKPIQAIRAFSHLEPELLHHTMEEAIEKTEILKRRFRHCAGRALMILRNYKGKKKRVGRQQVSSMILLKAVRQIDKDFSILKEARREVLEDLMDIENAKKVLEDIKENKIKIKETKTTIPSPFAFNLVTQSHLDIMRMEDRVDFINRMHKMVLAKIGKKRNLEELY
jgi:ATP-dependent Lhr-like helicase